MHTATLRDDEFNQFRSWLHRTAGINLSDAKKALVSGRLSKRLKHYDLTSYGDYFRLITQSTEAAELQTALDLLTTNETYFFREPKHFDFLRGQILPKAHAGKTFRLWSAASSSGEEPYSLAMTLADGLSSTPWEIVASDISTRVLEKARSGHYDMERAHNIPQSLLSKHCLKGTGSQEGTFMIERSLRSRMQFMQINLNTTLPKLGEFDVIFLRNVMIYFDMDTKRQVVARMLPFLKPGGYFIVSHSESLNGITDGLKLVSPVYIQQAMKRSGNVIEVFLQPGDFYFGDMNTRIRTLLGSCVSITMWHPTRLIGGMCHYLLPARENASANSLDGRYAKEAMQMFAREIRAAKTHPSEYTVKLFGAGNMFPGIKKRTRAILKVALIV